MNIKGMNSDMTCRGFQFEIGKEYKIENNGKPLELCSSTVFHYCKSIEAVNKWYPVDCKLYRYFEIEVLGKEITDKQKCGSDHIKIIREIEANEVMELSNTGEGNDGYLNYGNNNEGNYNYGNCNRGISNYGNHNIGNYNKGNNNKGQGNTGNGNIGKFNEGFSNVGDKNIGNYNRGDYNIGSKNVGSYNIGNWNTGHFNKSNRSNGIFCTKPCVEFSMFNKPAIENFQEYYYVEKIKDIINSLRIGFYDIDSRLEYDKYVETVFNMPNFDPEIFKEITGLDLMEK